MQLNRSTFDPSTRIGASAPDATGIVHLGIGQFHRAHLASYTAKALAEEAGDWGIVGVANRSRGVVDGLRNQDFLYSVLQLSPGATSVGVMDVHRRGLVCADEPADVLDSIADPAHKIISLTITEKGYHRTPSGEVDRASFGDEVSNPLPTNPLGLLARGLAKRYQQGAAPLTVLSCDNLPGNGTATRDVMLAYLDLAGADQAAQAWVAEQVSFPNSMVDRIVPGTTDDTRRRVAELLGLEDAIPVPAEEFTMWVLEDKFVAGRPAWDKVGATFSDEVERYDLVKLRILNGMHSLISYLGALDGRETIPASRGQEFVEACVRQAISAEVLPSITLPTGFDADAYVASLFQRWSNDSLGDKIARVGSDGSAKLLQRVPEPALNAMRNGKTPNMMALTVAAWIACVCPIDGFDAGPVAAAMDEPVRAGLAEATRGATSSAERAQRVLNQFFPPELASSSVFAGRVGELLDIIVTKGVRDAARDALGN